jgi:catechol 2,3-dioxygenase-like lactoylglutathione lyase family enzyme
MDLAHIAVSTADLDRALKWYRDFFGFEEIKRFEKQEFEIKGATIANGRTMIEVLMPYKLAKNPTRPSSLAQALRAQGLNHIALNTEDINGCFEKLKTAGECLVTELIGGRFFFCCDPDGTLIEIKQK